MWPVREDLADRVFEQRPEGHSREMIGLSGGRMSQAKGTTTPRP